MIKVSIIISNYNYGKYLPKALDSALRQDYPADQIEVILVDDASTDPKTRAYVENYNHPRVKKILLEENVGVVRARNIAIGQSQGSYIIPLDADDWFEPDYVRYAVEALDNNTELGLVYGLGELVGDAHGQWLKPFNIETLLLEGGTPACSMYRKEVWQHVGGYHDYMYNGWEDWDFWLSVLEHGYKIETVEGTVGFYYRVKAYSRSSNQAEKHLPELWKNLYSHHKTLYHQYPQVLQRVLIEGSHGRVILRGPEYRIGHAVAKVIRRILGPLFPVLMQWKARADCRRRRRKK